eukprot:GHVT01009301.1.p2 GENE.GHVT01009301.1~~GHVT01009301.1.p2  ORF type:complete len:101 (-),score=26.30 GHVT01009301.1:491-793(-)
MCTSFGRALVISSIAPLAFAWLGHSAPCMRLVLFICRATTLVAALHLLTPFRPQTSSSSASSYTAAAPPSTAPSTATASTAAATPAAVSQASTLLTALPA